MSERIGDAFKVMGRGHDRVHKAWRNYDPDLYSTADAKYILSKAAPENRDFLFGKSPLNPTRNKDRAKIWSLPPEVLETVKGIVKDAGHVHTMPFVLGTYEMDLRKMRMNDVCITDPYMGYLVATGGLEGFSMPFLRGLYYAGRSSWWRHESIHARHHHQMAYFLEAADTDKQHPRYGYEEGWQSKSRLDEAAYTIHESGIEELFTRWQALRESRGVREKAVSTVSLLFYMEYATFTGIRNMFIDTKERTADLIENGGIRVPLKVATAAGIMFLPSWLNGQTHFVDNLGDAASNLLPLTNHQVTGVFWRGQTYVGIAAVSALFSTKEKGAFKKLERDGERLPTTEYKFPYAYSPVTAVGRSIGLLRYLSGVWDQIPNYRLIESPGQVDAVKREVDDKVAAKMDPGKHQFTMQVVEDALRPFEQANKSAFPQDVYLKGMFTPALYLRLRELYR
ncbi:hypothetical protein M1437_02840 [Patescibacteria group bacterium]|nr:hypothetical protein [Patescibacteria group bacterium]